MKTRITKQQRDNGIREDMQQQGLRREHLRCGDLEITTISGWYAESGMCFYHAYITNHRTGEIKMESSDQIFAA